MNNPKFREKVLIGLENAPPSFNVRGKVVGPNGANLQYITNETGAIVTIRGRGSGYIEPNTGQESLEPLHICIEHSKYDVLQAGRQLAFNLIDTVQQEWANLQNQMQQDQQQQQQQPPPVVSSSSNGPSQTIVANDGPQVVTSVAPPSSVTLPAGFTQHAVGQMITVPPPSHVTLPPPTLHIPSQMAPPQVATSTNNGTMMGQTNEANQTLVSSGGPSAGQEVAVSQASAQPPSINIPAQQQLFLSNQGTIIQPQTIIPQQQQIITPSGQVISAQPQVLAQSYLLQYMQTNSGQMVVSYPNMVRPANNGNDASRGQQFMLVQYGDGGAIKTSAVRAPAPQPQATVPQMVQIINPQTGQIQHVLQHIQPQVQMQQAQLQAHLQPQLVGQGGGLLGQQVLMPIQGPIQFTSQPQQMIITQPPPQLQQHQLLPSGQTLQHVIPTSTLNQVSTPVSINVSQKQIVLNIAKQQQQGLKRRYEGDQHQHLSIMDAQTSHQLHAKKGLGAEGMQRPSPAPQQDIIIQSGEKNQYGQDEWRRNSPLLTENTDGRGVSLLFFLPIHSADGIKGKYLVTKSVYFDIQIGKLEAGQLVIGLFGEIVPTTVENFFSIATKGISNQTYTNSTFHRIVKGSFVQGGDILNGDGSGTISIYGPSFDDENFIVQHSSAGFVSMANSGPDSNGSQFFITMKATPWLDGVHVVFGKVIDGYDVILKINEVADDIANKPNKRILITDCGEHTLSGTFYVDGIVNRRSLCPGDPNGLDPNKRGRMTQNGQGTEVGTDTRNESGVERFPVKVEGGQHTQPPPQIYNVTAVPQQQQGIGVQRQQQPMQQIYQTGNVSQQAGPQQQQQVPGGPAPGQLPPGSYAQQMYPPPPLPSSTGQVGNTPQQYVAPPIYNTMPPQQSYAAAPYNPWIMPS